MKSIMVIEEQNWRGNLKWRTNHGEHEDDGWAKWEGNLEGRWPVSKGDPTAAKADKELGEQGHLVRENIIKCRGIWSLIWIWFAQTWNFWVSNASLLCNGRHAERWQQSNLYQACTFEKSLKNSMRLSMFPSLKLELDLNCLPTPVNLAGRQCQAATF